MQNNEKLYMLHKGDVFTSPMLPIGMPIVIKEILTSKKHWWSKSKPLYKIEYIGNEN